MPEAEEESYKLSESIYNDRNPLEHIRTQASGTLLDVSAHR